MVAMRIGNLRVEPQFPKRSKQGKSTGDNCRQLAVQPMLLASSCVQIGRHADLLSARPVSGHRNKKVAFDSPLPPIVLRENCLIGRSIPVQTVVDYDTNRSSAVLLQQLRTRIKEKNDVVC